MKKISTESLWTWGAMAVLFFAAVAFRPLLPIDETRYMTVAWEMRLHEGWLSPLTLNFEPYSHKPPLLFWLINIFWTIFGVGRAQGLLPAILSSGTVVILTVTLARKLSDKTDFDGRRIALLMLGSLPFLIYSTMLLFDLTMAVFVLSTFLSLIEYAQNRKNRYIWLAGLFIGLGVLTKGPVAYLYVIFPILLGPYWIKDFSKPSSWYGGCFFAIVISFLPVIAWIVPVLAQSDKHFAFWLLWEQTAGRVAGNFKDAHIRPFYFYLPFLFLMFTPWLFFPSFWRNLKTVDVKQTAIRFCMCWAVPTFLAFSFISGKQPHYLVPLLPAAILLISILLENVALRALINTALFLLMLFVSAHSTAWALLFPAYNLRPVAAYVQANSDKDWAWVRNYHGEIGYLAKLEKPITNVNGIDKINDWFVEHPDGLAVIRYEKEEEVAQFRKIISAPYRGKNMGIFERKIIYGKALK